jgi:hypothetical protein
VKFEQGDTKVLIVSEGVICYEHGMNTQRGFVPLGACSETTDCEQCQKGNDPSLKYKWIVYLPNVGEVRVLSTGPQIGDEICVIGKQINKADDKVHKTFEVVVNRVGLGRQTKYKVKKVSEQTPINAQTAIFIKQSRDYLYQKYLT